METKIFSKLALHQETVRNLSQSDRAKNELATHKCPPTIGLPACTPIRGVNQI